MRISHKHKFVFIAVPKTGSSTIRKTLDPLSDIKSTGDKDSPYYWHTSAASLKKHFIEQGWDWNKYYKFGFVRNPWDMVVSSYFYLKYKHESRFNYKDFNFEDFVFGGPHHTAGSLLNFRHMPANANQIDFFIDYNSEQNLVNYIGYFEDMQKDFNEICAEIGITQEALPQINKTKHKHYSEYYNSRTRDYIAIKYERDIDAFEYEFEQ